MGGTISADILDMAATGSADLGRTRITAAGRYSWVGGVVGLGSRLGAGGGDTWAHPRYVDTFLRVGHDVGPDTVEVTLLTARDALVVHHREGFDPPVIDGYDPDRLLDSWYGRLMTTWRRHGERPALTRLVFGPDLQSNQLTGAGVLGDGPENGSVRGWDVSLERIDELPLTPASWLEVGERVALRPVAVRDFKSLLGADSVADDRGLASGGAAWVELASKGPTEVGIGARVSIHGLGKRVWAFPEPRARLRTELAGPWSATWSGGRTSQLPRADQWSAALGDPSLSPATAWSTSLGFLGSWPSGLTFGATPYASVLSNVAIKETRVGIDPEPSPLGSHDLSSEPSYGAVKGRAAGVELLVRASGQERWFGWLALTLGRSWRIDGRTGFPADQDQPLALTALLSHGLGRGWRMSGRYRLTSGHPYTEQHAVFLATEDVWQGTPGPTNGERLSAFQQLDLRVDKRWSGRADWTLYLDVFNALNIRNALVATYNPNYTELVPVLSVPIVPSLGVEVAY
jgi:hypothetical protein